MGAGEHEQGDIGVLSAWLDPLSGMDGVEGPDHGALQGLCEDLRGGGMSRQDQRTG
jgi:hypothetical protein